MSAEPKVPPNATTNTDESLGDLARQSSKFRKQKPHDRTDRYCAPRRIRIARWVGDNFSGGAQSVVFENYFEVALTVWVNSLTPSDDSIFATSVFKSHLLAMAQAFLDMHDNVNQSYTNDSLINLRQVLCTGELRLNSDLSFHRNTNDAREKVVRFLTRSYNMHWLVCAICIVFGVYPQSQFDEILKSQSHSQGDTSKSYRQQLLSIVQSVLTDKLFDNPTSSDWNVKQIEANFNATVTYRVFTIIYLLDRVKHNSFQVFENDPPLFNYGISSSEDVVQMFGHQFIPSHENDLSRYLANKGYYLVHKATKAEREYDFRTINLLKDYRDGPRLGKLVSTILRDPQIFRSMQLTYGIEKDRNDVINKRNIPWILESLQDFVRKNPQLCSDIRFLYHPRDITSSTESRKKPFLDLIWDISDLYARIHLLNDLVSLPDNQKSTLLKVELDKQMKSLIELRIQQESLFTERKPSTPAEINEECLNLRMGFNDTSTSKTGSVIEDIMAYENEANTLSPIQGRYKSEIRNSLLFWVQLVSHHYNISVYDYNESFRDGAVLCLLLHHYHPDLIKIEDIIDTSLPVFGKPNPIIEMGYIRWNFHQLEQAGRKLGGIPMLNLSAEIATKEKSPYERNDSFHKANTFSNVMYLQTAYIFKRVVQAQIPDQSIENIHVTLQEIASATETLLPLKTNFSDPTNDSQTHGWNSPRERRNESEFQHPYKRNPFFGNMNSLFTPGSSSFSPSDQPHPYSLNQEQQEDGGVTEIQRAIRARLTNMQFEFYSEKRREAAYTILRHWRAYRKQKRLKKMKHKLNEFRAFYSTSLEIIRLLVTEVGKVHSDQQSEDRTFKFVSHFMKVIEETHAAVLIQRALRRISQRRVYVPDLEIDYQPDNVDITSDPVQIHIRPEPIKVDVTPRVKVNAQPVEMPVTPRVNDTTEPVEVPYTPEYGPVEVKCTPRNGPVTVVRRPGYVTAEDPQTPVDRPGEVFSTQGNRFVEERHSPELESDEVVQTPQQEPASELLLPKLAEAGVAAAAVLGVVANASNTLQYTANIGSGVFNNVAGIKGKIPQDIISSVAANLGLAASTAVVNRGAEQTAGQINEMIKEPRHDRVDGQHLQNSQEISQSVEEADDDEESQSNSDGSPDDFAEVRANQTTYYTVSYVETSNITAPQQVEEHKPNNFDETFGRHAALVQDESEHASVPDKLDGESALVSTYAGLNPLKVPVDRKGAIDGSKPTTGHFSVEEPQSPVYAPVQTIEIPENEHIEVANTREQDSAEMSSKPDHESSADSLVLEISEDSITAPDVPDGADYGSEEFQERANRVGEVQDNVTGIKNMTPEDILSSVAPRPKSAINPAASNVEIVENEQQNDDDAQEPLYDHTDEQHRQNSQEISQSDKEKDDVHVIESNSDGSTDEFTELQVKQRTRHPVAEERTVHIVSPQETEEHKPVNLDEAFGQHDEIVEDESENKYIPGELDDDEDVLLTSAEPKIPKVHSDNASPVKGSEATTEHVSVEEPESPVDRLYEIIFTRENRFARGAHSPEQESVEVILTPEQESDSSSLFPKFTEDSVATGSLLGVVVKASDASEETASIGIESFDKLAGMKDRVPEEINRSFDADIGLAASTGVEQTPQQIDEMIKEPRYDQADGQHLESSQETSQSDEKKDDFDGSESDGSMDDFTEIHASNIPNSLETAHANPDELDIYGALDLTHVALNLSEASVDNLNGNDRGRVIPENISVEDPKSSVDGPDEVIYKPEEVASTDASYLIGDEPRSVPTYPSYISNGSAATAEGAILGDFHKLNQEDQDSESIVAADIETMAIEDARSPEQETVQVVQTPQEESDSSSLLPKLAEVGVAASAVLGRVISASNAYEEAQNIRSEVFNNVTAGIKDKIPQDVVSSIATDLGLAASTAALNRGVEQNPQQINKVIQGPQYDHTDGQHRQIYQDILNSDKETDDVDDSESDGDGTADDFGKQKAKQSTHHQTSDVEAAYIAPTQKTEEQKPNDFDEGNDNDGEHVSAEAGEGVHCSLTEVDFGFVSPQDLIEFGNQNFDDEYGKQPIEDESTKLNLKKESFREIGAHRLPLCTPINEKTRPSFSEASGLFQHTRRRLAAQQEVYKNTNKNVSVGRKGIHTGPIQRPTREVAEVPVVKQVAIRRLSEELADIARGFKDELTKTDDLAAREIPTTIQRLSRMLSSARKERSSNSSYFTTRKTHTRLSTTSTDTAEFLAIDAMRLALVVVKGCAERDRQKRHVILALRLLDKLTLSLRDVKRFVLIGYSFDVLVSCASTCFDMFEVLSGCICLLKKMAADKGSRSFVARYSKSVRTLAKLCKTLAVREQSIQATEDRALDSSRQLGELVKRGIAVPRDLYEDVDAVYNTEIRTLWKDLADVSTAWVRGV